MKLEIYDRDRGKWIEVEGFMGKMLVLMTNYPFRITVGEEP